jgi:hypothetical protein
MMVGLTTGVVGKRLKRAVRKFVERELVALQGLEHRLRAGTEGAVVQEHDVGVEEEERLHGRRHLTQGLRTGL